MSRPLVDLPERLLAGDATDFERRMLAAALEKKPSSAASARMGKALGVTVATVATATTTATAGTALAAGAAAAKAPVAAGAAMWPWISAGVLGLVVAGAVVATRIPHTAIPHTAPADTAPASAPAAQPAPPGGATSEPGDVTTQRPPAPAAASRRSRTATAAGAVAEQTAFIDTARAAVAERSDGRALEILRRYQEKYPAGLFRPEATALKVEALVHLGRDDEARALAQRFVAEHRGTLLGARVAEIAGLA
jgi:hypothetical protein